MVSQICERRVWEVIDKVYNWAARRIVSVIISISGVVGVMMMDIISSVRLSKASHGQQTVVCFLYSEEGIVEDVILTRSYSFYIREIGNMWRSY